MASVNTVAVVDEDLMHQMVIETGPCTRGGHTRIVVVVAKGGSPWTPDAAVVADEDPVQHMVIEMGPCTRGGHTRIDHRVASANMVADVAEEELEVHTCPH